MRVESIGITISLEQDEIIDFWNIVMFALDLQAERDKQGKPCMTESEKKFAKKLVDILEPIK